MADGAIRSNRYNATTETDEWIDASRAMDGDDFLDLVIAHASGRPDLRAEKLRNIGHALCRVADQIEREDNAG